MLFLLPYVCLFFSFSLSITHARVHACTHRASLNIRFIYFLSFLISPSNVFPRIQCILSTTTNFTVLVFDWSTTILSIRREKEKQTRTISMRQKICLHFMFIGNRRLYMLKQMFCCTNIVRVCFSFSLS